MAENNHRPALAAIILAVMAPLTAGAQDGGDDEAARSESESLSAGDAYFAETFTDWQHRCVRAPEGQSDRCQLYQLLEDGQGTPVAEISVTPLPERQEGAAGATIVTPLETLLPPGLTLSVDGGEEARYPFRLCDQSGCIAQFGMREAELLAFKRGAEAAITIVPARAPDQTAELTVSLSGFTAGYDALIARRTGDSGGN